MRHDQSNLHDKMNHFGSYLHFVAEAADQLSGFSANPSWLLKTCIDLTNSPNK